MAEAGRSGGFGSTLKMFGLALVAIVGAGLGAAVGASMGFLMIGLVAGLVIVLVIGLAWLSMRR